MSNSRWEGNKQNFRPRIPAFHEHSLPNIFTYGAIPTFSYPFPDQPFYIHVFHTHNYFFVSVFTTFCRASRHYDFTFVSVSGFNCVPAPNIHMRSASHVPPFVSLSIFHLVPIFSLCFRSPVSQLFLFPDFEKRSCLGIFTSYHATFPWAFKSPCFHRCFCLHIYWCTDFQFSIISHENIKFALTRVNAASILCRVSRCKHLKRVRF